MCFVVFYGRIVTFPSLFVTWFSRMTTDTAGKTVNIYTLLKNTIPLNSTCTTVTLLYFTRPSTLTDPSNLILQYPYQHLPYLHSPSPSLTYSTPCPTSLFISTHPLYFYGSHSALPPPPTYPTLPHSHTSTQVKEVNTIGCRWGRIGWRWSGVKQVLANGGGGGVSVQSGIGWSGDWGWGRVG